MASSVYGVRVQVAGDYPYMFGNRGFDARLEHYDVVAEEHQAGKRDIFGRIGCPDDDKNAPEKPSPNPTAKRRGTEGRWGHAG